MFMPGFLIPADLERMIPTDTDPLQWAEANLLASPGAIVAKEGELFRIPTLVMATKPDGSCIYYVKRRCQIWETSPFGCAFFGCGSQHHELLSEKGLFAVLRAWRKPSLYTRIWNHLWDSQRRADAPEEKRARMNSTN
jgi:hypothetical protein